MRTTCHPLPRAPFAWFPVAGVTSTLQNLSRHEKTPGHQAAVQAFPVAGCNSDDASTTKSSSHGMGISVGSLQERAFHGSEQHGGCASCQR